MQKEEKTYTKVLSNFITKLIPLDELDFKEETFDISMKEETLSSEEMEALDIFDPNGFDKINLLKR